MQHPAAPSASLQPYASLPPEQSWQVVPCVPPHGRVALASQTKTPVSKCSDHTVRLAWAPTTSHSSSLLLRPAARLLFAQLQLARACMHGWMHLGPKAAVGVPVPAYNRPSRASCAVTARSSQGPSSGLKACRVSHTRRHCGCTRYKGCTAAVTASASAAMPGSSEPLISSRPAPPPVLI